MGLAIGVGLLCAVLGAVIGWLIARQVSASLKDRAERAEQAIPEQTQAIQALHAAKLSDAGLIAGLRADLANRDRALEELKGQVGTLATAHRAALDVVDGKLNDERTRYGQLTEMLGGVRGELNGVNQTLTERSGQLAQANGRTEVLTLSVDTLHRERTSLSAQLGRAQTRATTAETALEQQRAWFVEQTEVMRASFAEMARAIVEDKTAAFKKDSAETLGAIMTPLRTQIDAFQQRIDAVHNEDTQSRASLRSVMENMGRSQQMLSDQAQNLTLALTTKPRTQGDFGELKLETQLQDAGFEEGIHYQRQPNFKTDAGKDKRPDVVINMPTRTGYLAVDSKVTLTSWVNVIAAKLPEDRQVALSAVAASLRNHVAGLGGKSYPALMSGESPVPYTLMYVPIEGAVQAAMEHDPSLFADAQRQKVIIATPSTLFVMLSIIADLWRVANQEANVKAIALDGAKLLDKLNGFLDNFGKVGKKLDETTKLFADADGQLHSGNGSAISIVKRMARMGVQGKGGIKLQQSLDRVVEADADEDGTAATIEAISAPQEPPTGPDL